MRIISNFKDYYDYVAHLYGGGDPKIIYNRPLRNKEQYTFSLNDIDVPLSIKKAFKIYKKMYRYNDNNKDRISNVKALVICNRLFTVVYFVNGNFTILTDDLFVAMTASARYFESFLDKRGDKIEDFINVVDDGLVKICRTTKKPVMLLNFNPVLDTYELSGMCPILNNYGISKFISPEQIYQELSYFVGNTIHESPDTMPPVVLSDKSKILKGGFDLKTSFRNTK